MKSAAGIACSEVVLGEHGLQHDREWMVVDAAGRFVTQRNEARLALLATAIADGKLRLSSPAGAAPALDLSHDVKCGRCRCGARAFPHLMLAPNTHSSCRTGWASPCVWCDSTSGIAVFPTRTGLQVAKSPTLFSDGYPMLVLSQASIADLSTRVGQDLPAQRFRPNLLLDGVDAYAEDAAVELVAGAVPHCPDQGLHACVITTIDHLTGERSGEEPLRTLKVYRFDAALRGVVFGRNAYATAGHRQHAASGRRRAAVTTVL